MSEFNLNDPIIIPGQLYVHPALQEYLVIYSADNGTVKFRGTHTNEDGSPDDSKLFISGIADPDVFVENYDVPEVEEIVNLNPSLAALFLSWCPPKTCLSQGFIVDDSYFEEISDEE